MKLLAMLGEISPTLLLLITVVVLVVGGPFVLGAVLIKERQVGIVVKRFGGRALPPGRLIALNGEAGYQAATLAPGLHFGYWRWQHRITKAPVTVVPQGQIALVVAADGAAIPTERILGRVVDCDNFQDAGKFLLNGGEKGRQLGVLTAGTYRINRAIFSVITLASAPEHGMTHEDLLLHRIEPDRVGVVPRWTACRLRRVKSRGRSSPVTTTSRMRKHSSTSAAGAGYRSKSCFRALGI